MAPDTAQIIPKQGNDITYSHMVDEVEALGPSDIQKAFSGSSVFLTGATGFLGKLLVDKLLRSCPKLDKLFILVRPKKNKEILKRLQEQFDDVLYERLRKEVPNFMQKLVVVAGDVGEVGLGLSEEDRRRIINEVDFIFHGAATVRFDEPLKTAVAINVRGTREMLTLARYCTKLKAMVHISTAYSNCTQRVIEEKFYQSPVPGDKLIELCESIDENVISNITKGLIGDSPNTYVYTKLAAENIVKEHGKGLPIALFRPSIVIATVSEPISGWIDNVYGPTGVVVGAAVGLLRVLHCNQKSIADLVPGDLVVNACIATAWKTARDYPSNLELAPEPTIPVYNYVSSEEKPLTWEMFMRYNEMYGFDTPSIQAVYYYIFLMTPSKFLYTLYTFFLHWIPAYLVDGIAVIIGKKPMLKKTYTKIGKFSEVIAYFALREWKVYNQNTQNLYKELNEADKHMFGFNMADVDWMEYFKNYIRGIRVYLLKDPMDTVPKGLRKLILLKTVHYIVCCILSYVALRLVWGIFSMILGF